MIKQFYRPIDRARAMKAASPAPTRDNNIHPEALMVPDETGYDYFSNIPLELLERIAMLIKGPGMLLLKQASKYFYHAVDYPRMWKIIFISCFHNSIHNTDYLTNEINFAEEVSQIWIIIFVLTFVMSAENTYDDKEQYVCIQRLCSIPRLTGVQLASSKTSQIEIRRFYKLDNVKVCHNKLIIIERNDVFVAPIESLKPFEHYCLMHYIEYINEGRFIGKIHKELNNNHHPLYELSDNNDEPVLYKIITIPSISSKLISVNKNLAILGDRKISNTVIIYNMNTMTKLDGSIIDLYFLRNAICSQVNDNVILIPFKAALHVFAPVEKTTQAIGGSTQLIEVEQCTESYAYYCSAPRIRSEQMVNIGGQPHHIVHCTVKKQHRFYDLTAKKMMATINCWIMHVWIPNTCYLVMATRDTVVVIDFHNKKVISKFKPTDDQNANRPVIKALQASRSSPVLLIGMTCLYHSRRRRQRKDHNRYALGTVLLYSARTGVRIGNLCDVGGRVQGLKFKIELSTDEKKMILWQDYVYIDVYDIGNCLTSAKLSNDKWDPA